MIPAAELPVGCTTACTSALPFFFIGTSNVQVTMAGTTQTVPETMQIESPYFNPFGAPIVLASADNAIVIAATYTRGTIAWTGTQFAGQIVGLLGTTQVSGVFNMTSSEHENLVTGTANDKGTMSFNSMTPSSLSVKGTYTGSSTIPTTNTSDCSFLTGIPGTCTETGFQSTGKFWMSQSSPTASDHESGHSSGSNGNSQSISGSYSGTWGVPALGCLTSITATVSQTSND